MAEDNLLEQFKGYFWPQALGLDPKANLKMREKIALAAMMQKRAFPKNFGEGLAAIGEALGDRRLAIELEKQDRLSQEAAGTLGAAPAAAAEPAPRIRSSYAPTTDVEPDEPTVPPPLATQVPPQQTPTPAAPVMRPPAPVPPPVQPPVVPPQAVTPPQAVPPDQQQSYEPGAPTRMLPRPYRPGGPQPGVGAPQAAPPPQAAAPQGPLPPLPPDPPAPTFNDRMAPAGPAAGPRAEGGDPRAAIAMAMLQQGAPPENPTTPAGGGPPDNVNGITDFSSQNRIPRAPAPVLGYVPPERPDPESVPPTPPSRREMELRTILRQHQGNPYAAQSPAAVELQQLEAARARKDTEAQEIFKANIARTTKREEQIQQGLMDQAKREAEALETRQKLINYGQTRLGENDPSLLGTDRSPQRSGQPEADPVPKGLIPADWAKSQEKQIVAAKENLETVRPELKEALDLMDKVRAHPAKEASIGTFGGLAKLTASGQGFAALNEQLKGKNLVAAYQKIKGTGPVGEREGENIAKAQSALSTATTLKDYNDALDTLETTMRGAVERAERKMRQPVTAYQKTPDDPYAPDIGQIGTRGGRTVEYIGGDPAKDTSYRTVRR